MNKEVNSELFQSFYLMLRPYFMAVLMIFVSTMLVLVAIIPQVSDLFSTISQRNDAVEKLAITKKNLLILQNTDEFALESQLNIALKAVPQIKDFEGILNTISRSASKAGVNLGSYEFRVGDLSNLDSKNNQYPSLSVSLVVNDGALGASRFLTEMAKALPLSEVKTVEINGNYTNIAVLFYYKSLPTLKISNDIAIPVLSAKQKQTLSQIESWDSSDVLPLIPLLPVSDTDVASSSAL